MEDTDKRVRYIVDGFLHPYELMNISAPSGTGKTKIAIDLAASVATGSPWMGLATRKSDVLYACVDTDNSTMTWKLYSAIESRGDIPTEEAKRNIETLPLLKSNEIRDAADYFLDQLRLYLSMKDYGLVIVDTMSELLPRKRCRDAAYAADRLYGKVADLCEIHGCAVVMLLHEPSPHSSMPVSDKVLDAAAEAAETNVALEKTESGIKATVTSRQFKGRRTMLLRHKDGRWTLAEDGFTD